jgi:putative addiction module component (TIGR02574 family)
LPQLGCSMRSRAQSVRKQVQLLPDAEKLQLVDVLLAELDKPDPEIDRVWAAESQRRWKAYKTGKMKAIRYDEVIKRITKQ